MSSLSLPARRVAFTQHVPFTPREVPPGAERVRTYHPTRPSRETARGQPVTSRIWWSAAARRAAPSPRITTNRLSAATNSLRILPRCSLRRAESTRVPSLIHGISSSSNSIRSYLRPAAAAVSHGGREPTMRSLHVQVVCSAVSHSRRCDDGSSARRKGGSRLQREPRGR